TMLALEGIRHDEGHAPSVRRKLRVLQASHLQECFGSDRLFPGGGRVFLREGACRKRENYCAAERDEGQSPHGLSPDVRSRGLYPREWKFVNGERYLPNSRERARLLPFAALGYNLGFVSALSGQPDGHAGNSAPQHAQRQDRSIPYARTARGEDVHLWADGIRLRAHRKLPHIRFSGHSA